MTVLQWNIASGPILDVGQGKNVIDSKQRYWRWKQAVRKVKRCLCLERVLFVDKSLTDKQACGCNNEE